MACVVGATPGEIGERFRPELDQAEIVLPYRFARSIPVESDFSEFSYGPVPWRRERFLFPLHLSFSFVLPQSSALTFSFS